MRETDAYDLIEDETVVRVRVWDGQHSSVFVEGRVIAFCSDPMICVEDDDGARHWHPITLPMDIARWTTP
jgi:hypothetical protein